MTPSQRLELESLASDACQGRLTEGDQARLEQLVSTDEEARLMWLDYCRLHVEIGLYTRADAITRRLRGRIASHENGEITEAVDEDSTQLARVTPRPGEQSVQSSYRRAAVALVAIAASLLVLLALPKSQPETPQLAAAESPEQTPKRRPEVVALLTTPQLGDDTARERVVLAGEQIAVAKGRADVKMIGGANLFLDGPATLRFESPSHVRLLSGSLSANLPEWAKGFVVDTKAMRLIDLGTTFAVTAESATIAEAEVLQGLVKVQPREHSNDSLSGFLLNEGESVRVNGTHATRASVDLHSADVLRRIGELAKMDSYQPIPMHNTGARLREGEEDPFWRIVAADPNSGVSTPRYAVVSEPHRRYAINEPLRSQWISTGRSNELLPADSAYTFQTELDFTRYDVKSVRLIGQILADNGVKEVRVNDRTIKGISWIDNVLLQNFHREEFHVLEISEGFKPGVNLVEIDVWNGGEYRGDKPSLKAIPNPMALRVEWQAFGRPLLVN